MLDWRQGKPTKAERLVERILEAMREIGVLLVAFAPLDAALLPRDIGNVTLFLGGFLGVGLLLFLGALVLEWRFAR